MTVLTEFGTLLARWDQEFTALRQQLDATRQEVADLRQQLPEWVDEQEAQRLTGLSQTSLWRERKKKHSLIVWKRDHGVHYQRASLLAHNHRLTVRA